MTLSYMQKEEIKCNNIKNNTKFDHPWRILIIGGPQSGKINVLLNLIKQKDDHDYGIIDKNLFII